MVKRKRVTTTGQRRLRKRRRTRGQYTPRPGSRFTRRQQIVPATKTVRLRYVQIIKLDAAAGGLSTIVFSANSAFSPLAAGSAHQPLGFDEWTTFYDHYNVVGSKCTARFMSTGTTGAADTNVVGIMLKDNTAISAVPDTLMEQPKATFAIITQANANQTKIVRKNYSARKFFNLKDVKDNRTVVGASTSANPNEQAYYHVFTTGTDTDELTNPARVNVVVTIDYIVNFSERKTLLGS